MFYAEIFPSSEVVASTVLPNTPSGDVEIVWFKIKGYKFLAISGGPYFYFNPSLSFMVNFSGYSAKIVESIWDRLAEKGNVFDAVGRVSSAGDVWLGRGQVRAFVAACVANWKMGGILHSSASTLHRQSRGSERLISVFKNSRRGQLTKHLSGPENGKTIFTDFMLEGQWFSASDSSLSHDFSFNESVSFMVYCDTQAEIDYYWEKLSAMPDAEQCGWPKDRYGVSWQISHKDLDNMLLRGSRKQVAALMETKDEEAGHRLPV